MAKKAIRKVTTKKKGSMSNERKLLAFLAVFLTLIGFILALLLKRDDKYVMHYAKQGLVLVPIEVGVEGGLLPVLGLGPRCDLLRVDTVRRIEKPNG